MKFWRQGRLHMFTNKMAAASSNLITQLHNKLKDESQPIKTRSEMALKVFCSSAIPILQKEEEVLSWIVGELSQCKEDGRRQEDLYACLTSCLSSSRSRTFNGNLKHSLIPQLLNVLDFDVSSSKNVKSLQENCCYQLFHIPFFQRWFMCDVNSACLAASNYFKFASQTESTGGFSDVINRLLYIHKMTLLKSEFRMGFIKDVLVSMCSVVKNVEDDKRVMLLEAASTCWKEILFYEPLFIQKFINTMPTCDDISNAAISFRKIIWKLPTKGDIKAVEVAYSICLRAVVLKYPQDFNRIFRVFTELCPPLGINVDRIISIEMCPVAYWEQESSFIVMKSLIDVLDRSKIPLTCQLEEVSLQNWFTSLVIGLTNLNRRSLSAPLLELITRVYEFNPLVIEPSVKTSTIILLKKKDPLVVPVYITFARTIIKGSATLQRLQKFISFFLENMKEYLCAHSDDSVYLDDVLPPDVIQEFCDAVKLLPTAQILAMTKSFLFHLHRDCANQIESSQPDSGVVLNTEVISKLLYSLLISTDMLHHTVPDVVRTKFKHLIEELQALLKLFGIAYQDFHDDRLLTSYLLLCRAFGRIKLLFREYEELQMVKPIDADLEATNLCYVHNYISPENWKLIAESIEEHIDCMAQHNFFELLIEKVEAVSQVEEGYDTPGTHAARYLLTHADIDWLWSKLLTLAPLFQSAELIKLVSKLVRNFSQDHSPWIPLINRDPFTENRRLLLGVEFSLLYRASKKMSNPDENEEESLSKKVISLISLEDLLEFELSQLITEDEELRENVEAFTSEMAALLNDHLLLTPEQEVYKLPHISLFEVVARLPIQYLSVASQNCALLAVVALLRDLPPDSYRDMLLFNFLLKLFDGPEKLNPRLFGGLNAGLLLLFVAERGSEYRGQRKLLKRICFAAFGKKKCAKQIFSAVEEPSASNVWIPALVIDTLIQVKKKHLGNEECKKPLERKKCLEELMKRVVQVVQGESASPELLYPYTVLFTYTVRYLPTLSHYFDALAPTLTQYVDFAFKEYGEGERLTEGLIEHRSELGEHFPESLITDTFDRYLTHLLPPTETCAHLLFSAATSAEFSAILTSLLITTKERDLFEDADKCRRVMTIWSYLSSGHLSNEKSALREDALSKLMQRLSSVSVLWRSASALHLIPPIMSLCTVIAKNTSIPLKSVLMDTMMVLTGEVPLSGDEQTTLGNMSALLDVLLSLYLLRRNSLVDRLPLFLQRYRVSLQVLAQIASPAADYSLIYKALPVAEKIERISTAMAKNRKELTRLAPYLLADLMSIFQKHNISPQLKFTFGNIVNVVLSMCDSHGIAYLKAVLPTGQQELFDSHYETFKKTHRFSGKV